MAFLWSYGHRTTSYARILVRADSGTSPSIRVGNATYTGSDLDAASKTSVIQVSREGTATFYIDGVSVDTATISFLESKSSYKLAWGSCFTTVTEHSSINTMLYQFNVDAFINQGDAPYCNNDDTHFGIATTNTQDSLANATAEATYLTHHHAFMAGDVSKDDYTYLSFFAAGTWSDQSDAIEAALISEQSWDVGDDIDGISGASLSFSLTGFELVFNNAIIGALIP